MNEKETAVIKEEEKNLVLDNQELDKVNGGRILEKLPVVEEHDYDDKVKKKIK